MPTIHAKPVLTESSIRAGGTTIIGLTIARALDEVLEEARGTHGQGVDPMSITIETERVTFLGETSLGFAVSAETNGQAR